MNLTTLSEIYSWAWMKKGNKTLYKHVIERGS